MTCFQFWRKKRTCWRLSRQHTTSLEVVICYFSYFIPTEKHVICWRLSRQHNRSFSKMQTCHMLTAQPSTYDMFALIELYGRKLQSVYCLELILALFSLAPVAGGSDKEESSRRWRMEINNSFIIILDTRNSLFNK